MLNPLELERVRQELEQMKPRSQLYELIKEEMKKRGRWKNRPRGATFSAKKSDEPDAGEVADEVTEVRYRSGREE